jgi:hypothetical protein
MDSIIEQWSTPQLIVVIPEELAGNIDLARNIHAMAASGGYDVFFLGILAAGENQLALDRSLATLKAVTADQRVRVCSKSVPSSLWKKTLAENLRPGDSLVYIAGHRVNHSLLGSIPIRRALEQRFDAPLIEISGLYHPNILRIKRLLSTLFTWAGFAAIIALFTYLEIELDLGIHGSLRMILFIALVSLEFGAVYIWNNVTQR